MKYKTLFEIPIYSMSEKEFHKRWEKRKTFLHNLFVSGGHIRRRCKTFCYPIVIFQSACGSIIK